MVGRGWARRAGACLACAVLAGVDVLPASAGSAPPRTPAPAGSTSGATTPGSSLPVVAGSAYLALGDSVTFGYRDPGTGQDPARIATAIGYPEVLGRMRRLTVVNASCPGETSASLISRTAVSGGCTNWGGSGTGYRALYPLHVSYAGSQLAFAVAYLRAHRDIRLVTLTVGASDFNICRRGSSDGCSSPAELRPLDAALAAHVRTILTAIRGSAHYAGQLVIVDYYATDYTGSPLDADILSLDGALDGAAAPFHVALAHGYPAFAPSAANRHEPPCQAGLLDAVSPGVCGFHPSPAGQAVLARTLARVIR